MEPFKKIGCVWRTHEEVASDWVYMEVDSMWAAIRWEDECVGVGGVVAGMTMTKTKAKIC